MTLPSHFFEEKLALVSIYFILRIIPLMLQYFNNFELEFLVNTYVGMSKIVLTMMMDIMMLVTVNVVEREKSN